LKPRVVACARASGRDPRRSGPPVRQRMVATVPHARRRLQRVPAPRGYPTVYMRYPPGRRTSAAIISWCFVQNTRKTT
jgi:hypothetical protein